MADDKPLHIAVIVGSSRGGRFAPTVAGWFMRQLGERTDMTTDLVDVAECGIGVEGPSPDAPTALLEAVSLVQPRMAAADAFVVITPEYNHSYPAALKSLIDWHRSEWHAKPVGFVSYGGVSGGLRAVEHLRGVFAELHAVTVRDTVSFHGAWEQFDRDGSPKEPEGCGLAAKTMLNQLGWWGRALRTARAEQPYEA